MQDGTDVEATTPETKAIPGLSDEESKKAAELIQRTYRGHRQRRELKGFGLDASTRWDEVRQQSADDWTGSANILRQSKMLDTGR